MQLSKLSRNRARSASFIEVMQFTANTVKPWSRTAVPAGPSG